MKSHMNAYFFGELKFINCFHAPYAFNGDKKKNRNKNGIVRSGYRGISGIAHMKTRSK